MPLPNGCRKTVNIEKMSEDHKKMKEDKNYKPRYPEMQEKYEEAIRQERNRDRQDTVFTTCAQNGDFWQRHRKNGPL